MANLEHAPQTPRAVHTVVVAPVGSRWESDAHRAAIDAGDGNGRVSAGAMMSRVEPVSDLGESRGIAAPPSVTRTLATHGSPLPPAVRQPFERRYDRDFSRVRVHAEPAAAQSARDVDARAYTVGEHIVFGAGQYAPDTRLGRQALAHELAHVVQQDGSDHEPLAHLQRLSVSDVLETGAELTLGPLAGAVVRLERQFIDDLVASVRESPEHVMEFFDNEVWEQIKQHWLRVTLVTGGLLLAEEAVAVLTAIPEPTLLTKVVAAILQIVILAVLGYFAAVEVIGAYEAGRRWLALARQAHGDPAAISAASRFFVRMVWHIVMAVLAVAGVRARIRGMARAGRAGTGGGIGPGPGTGTAAEAGAGQGGEVIPISRHPGYQPRVASPSGPAQASSSGSAFGPGGTARQLAPQVAPPEPVPVAPAPVPAPVASSSAPSPTPSGGTGVQAGPATAAGVSSAGNPAPRPPFVLRLPVEKAPHLATYRSWLGVLQSDPHFERGRPAQLDRWHQAHRIGGSHGIPAEVYERGHALGLTGERGERRVRVPDWTRTRSMRLEVDHIVELQLTPDSMRPDFDDVNNYELLDDTSNVSSRNRLVASIARERAVQVAFDPSAAGRVLVFDRVDLDGGRPGERWTSDEIRRGDQLDAYPG